MDFRFFRNRHFFNIFIFMASLNELHCTHLSWTIMHRDPHCYGIIGIYRPVEIILMPGCLFSSWLFNQSLIMIDSYMFYSHQFTSDISKMITEHEKLNSRVYFPKIRDLCKNSTIIVYSFLLISLWNNFVHGFYHQRLKFSQHLFGRNIF